MRGLVLLLVCFCGIAHGQINTGTLTGVITDPSSAVVAQAKVEMRNLDTGVNESSASNETGLYKAPFLRPGIYSVRIEAKGFRKWEAQHVEVLVSKETMLNAALEIGDTAESVTVEGVAPLVESTMAQASVNVDAQRVLHLPRLSSGIDRLALLAPGVVPGTGGVASNGAIFSANGQRVRSNSFLLDGQDNNARGPTGPVFAFNTLEAVAEYQIITNQFNAEYGMAQGSIINVTTRGGTNDLHGSGIWLHRNDEHMAALTNIERRAGTLNRPPKQIDNLFGGTLGGPIRKDKAFFFVYLNRQTIRREARVEAASNQLTPTEDGLRVLQQAFPNSNSVAALLRYGPLTRKEGNPEFLPGSRWLENIRTPTGQTVSIEMGRLVRLFQRPEDYLQAGVRGDFALGHRDRINARYLFRRVDVENVFTAVNGYLLNRRTPYWNAGANWTHIVSPWFVNELRVAASYYHDEYSDPSGLTYAQFGKNISQFVLSGGYLGFGLPNNHPQFERSRTVQVQDNVSHQLGRHALKYGFQWSRGWGAGGGRAFYRGQFQFNNFQDFVDNRSSFNGADGPLGFNGGVGDDRFWYLQDDFRILPNLTLNLGLRYELSMGSTAFTDLTLSREQSSRDALWDQSLPLSVRTVPESPIDRNNWAPRVGFAYAPRWSRRLFGEDATVFRGGYGISYDFMFAYLSGSVLSNAPYVLRYNLPFLPVPEDVTGDRVRQLAQPPRGRDPRQFQFVYAQISPDFHSPTSHSWSFGVQRRIGRSQAFELRYVGNRGIGLYQTRNGNPNVQTFIDAGFHQIVPVGVRPGISSSCLACNGRVNPEFAYVILSANTAASTYHGLQSRYDGRLFRQLALGVSYTWSRAIDNVSDFNLYAQNPFDITSGERGPAAFDIPHALALHFIWDLPVFASKKGFAGMLLGGWTLSGISRSYSGRPGSPQQNNNEPLSANDRAFNSAINLTPPDTRRPFSANPHAPLASAALVLSDGSFVDLYNESRPVTLDQVRWIYNNRAAARLFGVPFGTGRNVVRSPSFHQTDFALYKNIKIAEKVMLQLRFESENSFNHPNLSLGGTLMKELGFLNPTETVAAPRRLAAGVRLLF